MYKGLVLSIFTLFITTLHAQTINCRTSEENYFEFDTTRVTIYKDKYGACSFNISAAKLYDEYRSYSLNTAGHFFVFNVFSLTGSVYDSTGARSFYIAPILENQLELSYDSQQHLISVLTPSGINVEFDSISSQIANIEGIEWSEDTRINKDNKGGVELIKPQMENLYLYDFGWRQGSDPRALLTRDSKLISDTQTCQAQTKQLLQPIYDHNDDIDSFELRYQSSESIVKFLEENCP